MSSIKYLRRYTDALVLLDMIKNERISLTSPDTWFDKNDTLGLKEYGLGKGTGRTHALCLTEAAETGHHWQLFAGTSHGVCVMFDAEALKAHVAKYYPHLLQGPMHYINLKQLKEKYPFDNDELPFFKRKTFQDEKEYRIVSWTPDPNAGSTYDINIDRNIIQRVVFGPRMPKNLTETLRSVCETIADCNHIQFTSSRVENNESWHDAIIDPELASLLG